MFQRLVALRSTFAGMLALGLTVTAAAQPTVTSTWTGTSNQDNDFWSQEADGDETSNWSTAFFPDNGRGGNLYDVVIGGPAPTVLSRFSPVIQTLTVQSDGVLNLLDGRMVTIANGAITNDGTININDIGGGATRLRILTDTLLDGSGQIVFESNDDNRIESDAGAVLTIGSQQTLTTSAAARLDNSILRAAVVNNGVVQADAGELTLATENKTNNNLLQALNGGTLEIAGIRVENAAGEIRAAAGSTVLLNRGTIAGGRLVGSGTFDLEVLDAWLDGVAQPVTLASGARLRVESSEQLTVAGTLINDGTIILDDVGGGVAELTIDGAVALNGSGKVVFTSNDDNLINSVAAADVLTIGPAQELTTSPAAIAGTSHSQLSAATVNNGTITADEGGLRVDMHAKTNNGLLRAINGGTLQIATTVENAAGTITAGPGSTVELSGAMIAGGLLDGSGEFQVDVVDARFDGVVDPVTIAAGANVVLGTRDRLTVAGTLVNDGTITLDDVGGAIAELQIDGDVALNGSGQVLFASNDDNVIDAAAAGDVLTIGPDQELITSAAAIAGVSHSRVEAATVNLGTVTADTGGLRIGDAPQTNRGVLRAINGGELQIANTTVENADGVITAGPGSTVQLSGATIAGGLLNGSGAFEVDVFDAAFDGAADPVQLAAEANIILRSADQLVVHGTVINDGTITLNDVGGSLAELTILGDVALDGSGQVIFQSNDDNVINSANDTDVLTIGTEQELITGPAAIAGNSNSRLMARTVNTGTITAEKGGLLLYALPKTNHGTFRALKGGELVVHNGVDLTNYDAATNTLTGGNWEAFDGTLDFDGRAIQTIAADTRVALVAGGSIAAVTDHLETVAGTLAVHETAQVNVTGGLTTPGTLEFGLTDGSVDGFDATGIFVGDVVTFAGGTVDIVDLGLTPGTYTLVTWNGGRAAGDTDLTLGLTPANGWIYTLETIPLSELRGVVQLTVVIPEPGSLLLLGVLALGLRRR